MPCASLVIVASSRAPSKTIIDSYGLFTYTSCGLVASNGEFEAGNWTKTNIVHYYSAGMTPLIKLIHGSANTFIGKEFHRLGATGNRVALRLKLFDFKLAQNKINDRLTRGQRADTNA